MHKDLQWAIAKQRQAGWKLLATASTGWPAVAGGATAATLKSEQSNRQLFFFLFFFLLFPSFKNSQFLNTVRVKTVHTRAH